jgi:predicted CXXCH cytochrome family protein
MLKKFMISIIAVMSAAMFGTSSAEIAGSPHAIGNDPCVVCHTPHNANTVSKPLWNHAASTAVYSMYDSTFSSSIDMPVNSQGGSPTGISAACLSCHDGTLAVATNIGPITGTENLGTDLTNDHPINIEYLPNLDPGEFNPATDVATAGLKLYNGQVECATCHDVHNKGPSGVSKLLRASNTNSALCTTCHIK